MASPTARLMAAALALATVFSHAADPVRVQSPDNRWTVQVDTGSGLALTLTGPQGTRLLHQQLELSIEGGRTFAGQSAPASVDRRAIDETVRPVVPLKTATIQDRANEAVLRFAEGYALTVRVYNDGFAYRFSTGLEGDITIAGETQRNSFAGGDPLVFFGHEKDFYSHTEVSYDKKPLSQLPPQALASLPLLVRTANSGPALLFCETALESYPGQWMRVGANAKTLDGVWPALPTREEETSDRDIKVTERGNAIAKTSGKRSFPWRFVGIAATDAELLTNQLSYLLAEPSRIQDTAWIKPGKVQWDWWHDFNVYDVDFHAGVSQALYKHYIDFAAAHSAKYIILDEGWYVLGDLTKNAGDIDVPGLVAYGKKKNVGVILWASWSTLKKQFDTVMPLFESWGVSGLKVDFFQRDDQPAVEFYWKLAADGAKRKLLLDFHGAHKPAGLQRTYPNVLTFEGVKGLENCKWSDHITPEHDTTLPFIRQVAGPMDYTPGAMDNAQKEQFRSIFRRPMSQGTRCHQLAMYVVYESPLQMYADSPTHYRREPESLRFMERVPVAWDETRVLAAEVGKIVAVARRSGDDWFVGVLNGADARTLELDLSFIPQGRRMLSTWRDGPNAARDGRDFRYEQSFSTERKLRVQLAPGGGWTGILSSP